MFFWILIISAFAAAEVGITVILVHLSAGATESR
jgi:hypothetical protein